MKLKERCESCDQWIRLDYDESRCTPAYCPFCGEEFDVDECEQELDDAPETSDEWD